MELGENQKQGKPRTRELFVGAYLEKHLGFGRGGRAGDLDDVADAKGKAVERRKEEEAALDKKPSEHGLCALVAMDPSSRILRLVVYPSRVHERLAREVSHVKTT